jgi:hypothetical protein
MVMFYVSWVTSSIEWANTIFKMVIWLLFAPLTIPIFIILFVSLFWINIVSNLQFIISFLLLFIIIWTLAALKFEKKKIKVAISIVNALTLTVLAFSFFSYFGLGITFIRKLITIELNGCAIETILEILVKIVTLPYLLGGIWGAVALEIRDYKESTTNNFIK